jgi:YidC/Oxa1 family membrane protein insertase
VKDIAKQSAYEGDFRYAGVDDNYFMSTALAPAGVKLSYQPVSIPPADPKGTPRELVAYSIEPKQNSPLKYFIGPKDLDVLAALGPDLTRAINFGMFAPIVAPLLRSLKWVNGYAGNYGWSIVILTIIINLILFPLQHKSIVSMRRMQEIQPQMKAIQDRYAKYKSTDPEKQKMNSELMALYKDKGVNPAGGCVPMLLTVPVLYAMWAMLSTAIELRGAPFVGWIHDLTQSDPYYVAPLLMGATMFWQTKMTPAVGGDPAQQRMQMMMPVVMTAMFIWMPAGALLYYVVSNLWRIGQQYLTNAIIGPPNVRAARPPAERKVKPKSTGSK